jgi:hypothetical protein
MPVRSACSAHATRGRRTGATRRGSRLANAGGCRREGREFLRQLRRAAVRTLRSLPVASADQNLAVAFALPTMKFVNRHGGRIVKLSPTLNPLFAAARASRVATGSSARLWDRWRLARVFSTDFAREARQRDAGAPGKSALARQFQSQPASSRKVDKTFPRAEVPVGIGVRKSRTLLLPALHSLTTILRGLTASDFGSVRNNTP